MREENEIIANRRAKLEALRDRHLAFPNGFERTALVADLHKAHSDKDKETLETEALEVMVAGRIMLRRVMGKASFITLQEMTGTIQCYVRSDDIGASAYVDFKDLFDIGDIVGVAGVLMRTNRGELSVHASTIVLLTKSLRPLPEKYHGLTDQETKYRQRYLDLIMSGESRQLFRMRSQVIREIRGFFDKRDFLEVETPMMHPIPGGATARPFVTHHNALGMDLYLRVAPELYLKRLTVGGLERVYEINRSFRNEGLSTRHNPEFTMLEFYWAYHTFEDLMMLTQELMQKLVMTVSGSSTITYQGVEMDFGKPACRYTMVESVIQFTPLSEAEVADPTRLIKAAKGLNISIEDTWAHGRVLMEVFESCVEEHLIQPTFITNYPTEVSPLARRSDLDSEVTDRFEYFAAGREFANGFSEVNDPEDQAARFKSQAERKSQGDLEAMHYDADYVTALEYGMPPTAGEGIGIDRLVMLLSDSASIRDVLLFPHLRPKH
jgi:lysyl-tRNA synthetase class 2